MSEYKITDEQIGEIAAAVDEALGSTTEHWRDVQRLVTQEIRKAVAPKPKFRTVWLAWDEDDGVASLHAVEPHYTGTVVVWLSPQFMGLGSPFSDLARAGQCVKLDLPDTEVTR